MLIKFYSNKSEKITSMFFSNDFNVDYNSKIISIFNSEQKLYKHVPFVNAYYKQDYLEVHGDFN